VRIVYGGELLAIGSAFFWAAGASIYKKGLRTTDALSGNLIRTAFTTLGFFLLMIFKGTLLDSLHLITAKILFSLFFSAFFGFFLGDYCFMVALKRIGVSRTVPITSTYPLFIAAWSFLIYGTRITLLLIVGIILIISAITLITGEKDVSNIVTTNKYEGIGIALLAAVCWSISITILDYLLSSLPAEAVAGFRFLIACGFCLILGAGRKYVVNKNAVLWIGIGGIFVVVMGNYLFLEAVRLIGSVKVAPISSLYPIISILFATLLIREKMTVKIILGTILSFMGVLCVILS
jgi:DME family drug/metabolite transporter